MCFPIRCAIALVFLLSLHSSPPSPYTPLPPLPTLLFLLLFFPQVPLPDHHRQEEADHQQVRKDASQFLEKSPTSPEKSPTETRDGCPLPTPAAFSPLHPHRPLPSSTPSTHTLTYPLLLPPPTPSPTLFCSLQQRPPAQLRHGGALVRPLVGVQVVQL